MNKSPVLLIIFDGFGLNPSRAHNGWALADTPHLDHYFATNPHTAIQASGRSVGLPDGQFGNSEVGHLTLGAGRVLEQDLIRIAHAIRDGSMASKPEWQDMLKGTKRLHLVGLVSDGGVHSHLDHILGMLPLIIQAGVEPVIHMITDGRDTAPRSALKYLDTLEQELQKLGKGTIATVSGRYTAMDRTQNWDRNHTAWNTMMLAQGPSAGSAKQAIEAAYERNENDEFIQPTVIEGHQGIAEDEPVLFFNYRSDRARQMVAAFGLEEFDSFDRGDTGYRRVVTMTEYDIRFPFPVLFSPQTPEKVLAEVISEAGLKQFHCAEAEKYPHVTYFFNGGIENSYPGEDRLIVPSPDVPTYDLQPEMNAPQVANKVIAAIESDDYDFVLVNFANGDMVGHTGVPHAIIRAVETLDLQGHRVINTAIKKGWKVILTADHGNCDEMVDPVTGDPHTQHTEYPVPFLLIGEEGAQLGIDRGLADVAPTVLELLGVEQPPEMTGQSLILKGSLF